MAIWYPRMCHWKPFGGSRNTRKWEKKIKASFKHRGLQVEIAWANFCSIDNCLNVLLSLRSQSLYFWRFGVSSSLINASPKAIRRQWATQPAERMANARASMNYCDAHNKWLVDLSFNWIQALREKHFSRILSGALELLTRIGCFCRQNEVRIWSKTNLSCWRRVNTFEPEKVPKGTTAGSF